MKNINKLTHILRKKRKELDSKKWSLYLKKIDVQRTGIINLTKMNNKGQLKNKLIIQSDIYLSEPAKNNSELEGLDSTDLQFYVMNKETAQKILVLGLP